MTHNEEDKYKEILANWTVPEGKSTEEAWELLQQKLKDSNETPVVPIRKRRPWVAVASVAAVLLAVVWFGFTGSEELVELNSFTEQVEHKLPDGSVVILNASSQIAYDAADWADHRSLKLTGEAYFDVEKGSDFVVEVAHGFVKVHGTEFNVYARAESFIVKCYEGKVEVVEEGLSSVFLEEGEMRSDHSGSKTSFDHHGEFWKDGFFSWEDTPVREVLNEVERQYGVQIETDPTLEGWYSGSFRKVGIQEVLSLICEPMGFEHSEKKNGTYRIEQLRDVNIP